MYARHRHGGPRQVILATGIPVQVDREGRCRLHHTFRIEPPHASRGYSATGQRKGRGPAQRRPVADRLQWSRTNTKLVFK